MEFAFVRVDVEGNEYPSTKAFSLPQPGKAGVRECFQNVTKFAEAMIDSVFSRFPANTILEAFVAVCGSRVLNPTDVDRHAKSLADWFGWPIPELVAQLRTLQRIKEVLFTNDTSKQLHLEKNSDELLRQILCEIAKRNENLESAKHIVVMYYIYQANSAHCERIFSLAEALKCRLSGVSECHEATLFRPYLLVIETGDVLNVALAPKGLLEQVASSLLRKERRTARAKRGEGSGTELGRKLEFIGKSRFRKARSDKHKVRGPQAKPKAKVRTRPSTKIFAGMKREEAVARVVKRSGDDLEEAQEIMIIQFCTLL